MSTDYKEKFRELSSEYRTLSQAAPAALAGFGTLHQGVMKDAALDRKTKELIAMAIGIYSRCEGCLTSHTRGAVKAGASLDEISDAVGVSILMGGGPSTVYGAKAIEAAQQFAEGK